MADLKFLQGTEVAYQALFSSELVEAGTFYLTENNLYIGKIKLNNKDDIANALVGVATEAEMKKLVGELTDLETTAQDNVVAAINEIKKAVDSLKTAEKVTLETLPDPTEGMTKTYEIKQGGTSVGKIDIPKDMVVSSGEVVVNPEDQPQGTYIKLVLSNATKDTLFINVGKLVDIYSASEEDTAIELTIADNKIKAEIKTGRVTKEMLAADALEGLLTATSLETLIVEGVTDGTIAVNGKDVSVHGLKSAAFTASEAYDTAGAASAAQTAAIASAKEYTDGKFVWGVFPEAE